MKLSLKKTLARILQEQEQARQRPPFARMVHGGDTYLKDARTWHSLNAFGRWGDTNRWNINGTNYTYNAGQELGDEYFQVNNNGFKFMKSGWYLVSVDVHYNMDVSSQACALRLFNYTQNTNWSSHTEYQSTPYQWGHLSLTNILHISAGDIVVPQIQKYTNNTTASYRMSSVNYEALLLREDA